MFRSAVAILVAWGLCFSAGAQLVAPAPEIAAGVVTTDAYPAEARFANGVRGVPGAVYSEPAGYRPLKLDLYLPPAAMPQPAGGFPLVIYIHGEDWAGGDPRRSGAIADFPGVLASLSARGYVVASIEYRLSSEALYPAQARDVKSAIRWLRLNAAKYGIDPAQAVTWGVSAGGHLAALAAMSCNAKALAPRQQGGFRALDARGDPTPSVSDCVQGGVAWNGVFDMATIADQARQGGAMSRDERDAPEWLLLGCLGKWQCSVKLITDASPVYFVDREDPPMLLVVGSADTTVPYQQTAQMAATLLAAKVPHELVVLPGIGHDFIGPTPAHTRDANLKALEATFRFIDETIGKR